MSCLPLSLIIYNFNKYSVLFKGENPALLALPPLPSPSICLFPRAASAIMGIQLGFFAAAHKYWSCTSSINALLPFLFSPHHDACPPTFLPPHSSISPDFLPAARPAGLCGVHFATRRALSLFPSRLTLLSGRPAEYHRP
ncbi:hypothetical protein IF1G_03179 [Cordyceps javanica]|uniref:Uncharacterized protein n=1 Tax=Cordyceps javanica TaxID=43265 RepID=A0A545V6T8_9HYPO|nr:hypothetical protein IF1G_03179 [Cordyceps javanica]TQW09379.1 hypothetical protein IF2G_03810 [Cordyceps javanica]